MKYSSDAAFGLDVVSNCNESTTCIAFSALVFSY